MLSKDYGTKVVGSRIEFRLYAPQAEAVELCIFDQNYVLKDVIAMLKDSEGNWQESIEKDSIFYAYRLYGEWDPHAGQWFNPNKFLFDPYATKVGRAPSWDQKLFAYKNSDFELCPDSNLECAGLAAIADSDFDWKGDSAPNIPWQDTIIYEAHVKGLTKNHPGVAANIRGTYLGLCDPVVIHHLKSLGITALQLLPIQAFFTEYHLDRNGLSNYWGYNPYAWFAPEPSYASKKGAEILELKQAIKNLHAESIEVILDVVFNHSAEGEFEGPALNLRGIHNPYYLFDHDYVNYTGCGNTLDFSREEVRTLAQRSLETWVEDYHVDGFRFDLGTTLVRNGAVIEHNQSFFTEIRNNPILKDKKIIVEPWDLGPSSYQFGTFPKDTAEWNDKFRDTVRKFWAGWEGMVPDLATRVSGSSDVLENKSPLSSINFITAHDGFTLKDLVSYTYKNNESNLENNRDGSENNYSFNNGIEGETENLEINARREKQIRNFIFTLFFSAGVPMFCAGDEIGKTQAGNNNAYCQDNEISWLSWNLKSDFRDFVSNVVELRKELKVFSKAEFFKEDSLNWITQSGEKMKLADWQSNQLKAFGAVYINDSGKKIVVIYNSSQQDVNFKLQNDSFLRIDTSKKPYAFSEKTLKKSEYVLAAQSAALFVEC